MHGQLEVCGMNTGLTMQWNALWESALLRVCVFQKGGRERFDLHCRSLLCKSMLDTALQKYELQNFALQEYAQQEFAGVYIACCEEGG